MFKHFNFHLGKSKSRLLIWTGKSRLNLALYSTGMRPHSHHEHVRTPDTVLVHHHRGLEALSLRTGQPLTTVPLPTPAAAHVDLLQTGHLSSIRMDTEACTVEVNTQRYSGSVCPYCKVLWPVYTGSFLRVFVVCDLIATIFS